jgi:hypothetical protein
MNDTEYASRFYLTLFLRCYYILPLKYGVIRHEAELVKRYE